MGQAWRSEISRALGGRAERDPSLGCHGRAFIAFGLGSVCVEVVLRKDPYQLLVSKRLEVARCGQVPGPTVATR
jgi:hypothetical protein